MKLETVSRVQRGAVFRVAWQLGAFRLDNRVDHDYAVAVSLFFSVTTLLFSSGLLLARSDFDPTIPQNCRPSTK